MVTKRNEKKTQIGLKSEASREILSTLFTDAQFDILGELYVIFNKQCFILLL